MKIGDKYKGIFYIILAAFGFAFMNLFVKLAGDLPAIEKSFFRNLFFIYCHEKKEYLIFDSKGKQEVYFFPLSFWNNWNICEFLCDWKIIYRRRVDAQ